MKIEIENIEISRVINFLDSLKFKGLKSVNRSRLTRYLTKKLQEVADGEKIIQEDFKDDPKKLNEELKAYYKETVVIEGGNFIVPLNTVKAKIKELVAEDSEMEFSDNDAHALAILYDAFELGQNKGGDAK